jgi:hypothetical protein
VTTRALAAIVIASLLGAACGGGGSGADPRAPVQVVSPGAWAVLGSSTAAGGIAHGDQRGAPGA